MQINSTSETYSLPSNSSSAFPNHSNARQHTDSFSVFTSMLRSWYVDFQIIQMNPVFQSGRFGLGESAGGDIVESAASSVMRQIAQTEWPFPMSFQFLVMAIIEGSVP